MFQPLMQKKLVPNNAVSNNLFEIYITRKPFCIKTLQIHVVQYNNRDIKVLILQQGD